MAYLFGHCELDPGRYELRRDGRVIAVEPRVFDLLLYLVEHRDRNIAGRCCCGLMDLLLFAFRSR